MAVAAEMAVPGLKTNLVPGGRGDFIVTFGDQVLWNKRAQDDQFPDEGNLVRQLAEK